MIKICDINGIFLFNYLKIFKFFKFYCFIYCNNAIKYNEILNKNYF